MKKLVIIVFITLINSLASNNTNNQGKDLMYLRYLMGAFTALNHAIIKYSPESDDIDLNKILITNDKEIDYNPDTNFLCHKIYFHQTDSQDLIYIKEALDTIKKELAYFSYLEETGQVNELSTPETIKYFTTHIPDNFILDIPITYQEIFQRRYIMLEKILTFLEKNINFDI